VGTLNCEIGSRVGLRVCVALAWLLCCLVAWAAEDDPIALLEQYGAGPDRAHLTAVEDLVCAATSDPKRAVDVELRLLGILQSGASIETKQFVCRQLRLVGSDSSVLFLGRMLNEPKLGHMARQALEAMPSAAASAALRQALHTTRGDLLVGVINSLGERRESTSVSALTAQLDSRDVVAVQAAISALGKIGGEAAFDALRAVAWRFDPALGEGTSISVNLSEDVRRRLDVRYLFDALLMCAERLIDNDRADRAADTFARIYRSTSAPRPQRIAALVGLTRAAPDRAVPLILQLLRGPDPASRAAAANLVGRLPPASAAPIVTLLGTLPTVQQALVIEAVSGCSDRALLFPLLKATMSPDPAVRVTALRALGHQQGNRQIVQLLVAAASGGGAESAVARESLSRIEGPEVDADLMAQLDQTSVAMRAEAARGLGVRGVTNAVPRLVKALGDANGPIRFAAIESLGQLGGEQQLQDLLDYLGRADVAAEQEVAARAVLAIARRIASVSPGPARAAAEKVADSTTAGPIQSEAKAILDSIK